MALAITLGFTCMGRAAVIRHGLDSFKGKRVLLLQGPVGPFFRRLARDLQWAGAQVCKVNFNGGDWLFYPTGAIAFRRKTEEWPGFFARLIDERKIDIVLLFGDCRPIHAAIHAIATRRGVEVGVFEEGYIRPDYITLERIGVNGYSLIPRMPIFYLNNSSQPAPEPRQVINPFRYVVLWAILYYFASSLLSPLFRHYRHHRPLNILEALPWLRAVWRKAYYDLTEHGVEALLRGSYSGEFFLVPLQVHNDAQVHVHSQFDSVTAFIRHVMASFAKNAPSSTVLVIKHHPLDRGYRDYSRCIQKEAEALGISERVLSIHDQHLPTLLGQSRGVVVINSTVGLSAVHHDTPVKVCGSAVYDMQGLTFQGSLDEFWQAASSEKIDRKLYNRFRNFLINQTQLNGNFYTRMDIPGSYTGLVWKLPEGSINSPESSLSDLGILTDITEYRE